MRNLSLLILSLSLAVSYGYHNIMDYGAANGTEENLEIALKNS